MMTVSKPLTPGAAMTYYTRGNYYFESEGVWKGKLAEKLGLSGVVNGNDFSSLLNGFDPTSKEPLVKSAGSKEVVAKDGSTILKKGHQAGFDLTFSAPKSVSLLALHDPEIEKAFNSAVNEAMEFMETEFAKTRTKNFVDGKPTYTAKSTGNLAWAQFNHLTSRAVDPQLHAHCVVMNMTAEDEETTKTLKWELYNGSNSKFIGQFFRNSLAEKLNNLGYAIEVTDRKQGFFTIAGIGEEVEETFSKRSAEIDEKTKELRNLRFCDIPDKDLYRWATERLQGTPTTEEIAHEVDTLKSSRQKVYENFTDAALATEANLQSRSKKLKDLTVEDLKEYVNEQCRELGTSLDDLYSTAKQQTPTTPLFETLDELFDITMRDLTEMQSAFKKEDFISHCMKLSLGDYPITDIYAHFESYTETKKIRLMETDPPIYTTTQMIETEKQVIDYCQEGIGSSEIKVDKDKTQKFIDETDFDLKLGSSFKTSPEKLLKIFRDLDIEKFTGDEIAKIETILESLDKDSMKELYHELDESQQAVIKTFLETAGYGFTPGQRDAIELIAATNCQFSIIQGDAGTGKSFSMNYAREMLEEDGFIVRGFAPTGKASVELSNSAKIKGCQTIDKFLIDGALKQPVSHEEYLEARKEVDRIIPLLRSSGRQAQHLLKRYKITAEESEKMQDYQLEAKILKQDRKLNIALTSPVKNKEVWVVDESGMAGSVKYLKVMDAARKAGAKCIFVGDKKQFASIEAGKMFKDLQDTHIDKVIMPDVMRQKTDHTKEIVSAISMQEMDFAFDMMRGRKQIADALDDINVYQIGQLVYFHEDMMIKGERIVEAGESAKITDIGEDGTITVGVYDSKRNEHVDHTFPLESISERISLYESVHENVISEVKDRDARLEKVADDYLVNTALQIKNNPEKLFDTMIITATNRDRAELNRKIRTSLLDETAIPEMRVTDSHEFAVLESNSIGGSAKSFADSYAVGQKVVSKTAQELCGISPYESIMGNIVEIDKNRNRIIIEYQDERSGEAKTASINPSVTELSAFKETVKPFGVNDKIVFLKNDNGVNVRNGQLAIITDIDELGNVTADLSGEKVSFNLNEYNYIDHAYCLSEYKSQGATVGRLVWHADTKAGDVTSNSFYVAITRCTHEIALYTDSAIDLQEKVKREQFKYSTVNKFDDDIQLRDVHLGNLVETEIDLNIDLGIEVSPEKRQTYSLA